MSSHYPGVTGVFAAVRIEMEGFNAVVTARTGVASIEHSQTGRFRINYVAQADIRRTIVSATSLRHPNGTQLITGAEDEDANGVEIACRTDGGLYEDPDVLWVRVEILPVDTE